MGDLLLLLLLLGCQTGLSLRPVEDNGRQLQDLGDPVPEDLDMAEHYDVHELPPPLVRNKPLHINATINVRNILEVNERAQLVTMETTLRFFWYDTRIKPKSADKLDGSDDYGNYTSMRGTFTSRIWMPDVFLDRGKAIRVPTYIVRPHSLRVYTDSLIRYSSRFNFDVACNMNFHLYPFDEQECEIRFESFNLNSKQALFKWMDTVGKSSNLHFDACVPMAQFSPKVYLDEGYVTAGYAQEFTGIQLKMILTRKTGYHVVQTFIPSAVFCVLAYFSMYIPTDSIPGRVGMGMTALFTLTAMFASVRQQVPKVSYVTLLDGWMLMCIVIVFCCLAEFILVTHLYSMKKDKLAVKSEFYSRILVPVMFLLFNLVYWPVIYSIVYQRELKHPAADVKECTNGYG